MRRYDHGGDIYGKQAVHLDFSICINPLGMPQPVRDALVDHVTDYEAYPDPRCRELVRALAQAEGVPPSAILCGNGAADLIYRFCLAFKPHHALVCAPTFSEYERAVACAGGHVEYLRLREDEEFAVGRPILEAIDERTDAVFLCNPNNPTGQLVDRPLLLAILDRCEAVGARLVCDECFLPFTHAESLVSQCAGHRRLFVLKAFTKAYSLAGIRLGHVICSDAEALSRMREQGQCWNVSTVAQVAGIAALRCREVMPRTRAFLDEERPFVARSLTSLGFRVYRGDANYVLFSAREGLHGELARKGILIRSCSNYVGLDERFYRVGIKGHVENLELIEALEEVTHG